MAARDVVDDIVYVLCQAPVPMDFDFQSKRQKNPDKPAFDDSLKECQACGVSVTTDFEDLGRLQRMFKGMRGMRPAQGRLTPGSGKILATSMNGLNAHHTWWFGPAVRPAGLFRVLP